MLIVGKGGEVCLIILKRLGLVCRIVWGYLKVMLYDGLIYCCVVKGFKVKRIIVRYFGDLGWRIWVYCLFVRKVNFENLWLGLLFMLFYNVDGRGWG